MPPSSRTAARAAAAPARPISTSTGSGAALSMAPISSGVTIGTSPPASTPSNGGPWLVPARSSVLDEPRGCGGEGDGDGQGRGVAVGEGEGPLGDTRLGRQLGGPTGEPQRRQPSSSRSTSISCHDAAPMPTPSAFSTASLTAKRTA